MPRRLSRRTLALAVAVGLLAGMGLAGLGAAARRARTFHVTDQATTYPGAPHTMRPPDGEGEPPSRPVPVRLTLAVLGDSVPAGSACSCLAFAGLLGRRIAATTRTSVTVNNLGTPQETSEDLLASLAAGQPAAHVVAGADIITVTVGANDFSYGDYSPDTCAALSCYATQLQRMSNTIGAVLSRISNLRTGHPTAVRVTGYWDIWRDGAVGRAEGAQHSEVGDRLTRKVNSALAVGAQAHHATYVDLFTAFRGVDGNDDDTRLLASDGDHPNDAGHHLIAEALLGAGLAPLR